MNPNQDSAINAQIITLASRKFVKEDWAALSAILDADEIINGHPRLLRSLSFGDEDYPSCAASVMAKLLKMNEASRETIIGYVGNNYPNECKGPMDNALSGTISVKPKVFDCKKPFATKENQVALMMPYKEELNNLHTTIRIACEETGLNCVRADQVWTNSSIMQDVFDLIYTSKCVIADLSGLNANVMYEVGIAHSLGVSVILICDNRTNSPFDIAHHRHIKYNPADITSDNFVSKLKKALGHVEAKVL